MFLADFLHTTSERFVSSSLRSQPGQKYPVLARLGNIVVIVFVCTGNTCRSPLAEALFKKRLADALECPLVELSQRGFQVFSAGLAAHPGQSAAAESKIVAQRYGADLSQHRSQSLTAELAERADLLITMTQSHLRVFEEYLPQVLIRSRLLDPTGDIADPIGQPLEVYEECGQHMWQTLESLVEEVQHSARRSLP